MIYDYLFSYDYFNYVDLWLLLFIFSFILLGSNDDTIPVVDDRSSTMGNMDEGKQKLLNDSRYESLKVLH